MDNPLKLKRIHHVEFWVGNAEQSSFLLPQGLRIFAGRLPRTGNRQPRAGFLCACSQDKTNFVLSTPLTSDHPAAEHIKKHGDGVRDIALEVADADFAFEEAVRRGAKPFSRAARSS